MIIYYFLTSFRGSSWYHTFIRRHSCGFISTHDSFLVGRLLQRYDLYLHFQGKYFFFKSTKLEILKYLNVFFIKITNTKTKQRVDGTSYMFNLCLITDIIPTIVDKRNGKRKLPSLLPPQVNPATAKNRHQRYSDRLH